MFFENNEPDTFGREKAAEYFESSMKELSYEGELGKTSLWGKSRNSETFTLRKSDLLGVGSCKFDTYRFNIDNLQK